MPTVRLSMRKLRDILRLHAAGHSQQQISHSCGIGRSTVGEYLQRARDAGITWPLPAELDDATLEQRLFPPRPACGEDPRGWPDWAVVHRELRRPGVTLLLLWEEYKARHPQGYQYTWFCRQYRAWAGRLTVVMRQHHRAGETVFVDYAGQTVAITDRQTGEQRPAQIFVAVLGASNYTYAEASESQQLENWLLSHVRAFEFFGGVPATVVPDNLKAGVSKAHRYEPDLNPSYAELAAHYGVAVIPARIRKPRDKAKVENAVLVVERWILARLRHATFFSLDELNAAIRTLLTALNQRAFKKLPGSRQQWFTELERPALRALPAQRYTFAHWKKARVNIDYHIDVERHYYSVPYPLVRQEVDVRLTAHTVEIFHRGKPVTAHRRSTKVGHHSTVTAHMPKTHRQYAEWTPQRLIAWARQTGPRTAELVERILASRPYPPQGFRSCLGILRLGKSYGKSRLEAACHRALVIGGLSYKSVESILKRHLDQQPLPAVATPDDTADAVPEHANIRGARYYH
jgi:transposase